MAAVKKNYVVETIRKGQMIELLAKGKRLDGRALDEHRPLTIETGFIQKANGSAMVSLGHTQVLAGVKVATGTPFPDTPDKGLLVVNAEVLSVVFPLRGGGTAQRGRNRAREGRGQRRKGVGDGRPLDPVHRTGEDRLYRLR